MSSEERERLVAEIRRLDAEIAEYAAGARRRERVGVGALAFAGTAALYAGYCLYESFAPRGDAERFLYCLLAVVASLGAAYRLIFNPSLNRKIFTLQEERFALRRRLESV
jgi:hypothetical protein